ncbi:MAG: cytochrome C oxidase subunit IV family protein [Terriglobales bacterium]
MAEVIVRKTAYLVAWVVLMVLTVVTAVVSFIDLGMWSGPVALTIASVKALVVALIFMHIRYEKQKIVWVAAFAGVFWLAILLVLSMTDYLSRTAATISTLSH